MRAGKSSGRRGPTVGGSGSSSSTSGVTTRPLVLGFDCHMFDGAGIFIGPAPGESPRHLLRHNKIVLRGAGGVDLCLDSVGASVGSARLRPGEVVRALEGLFQAPDSFELTTSECSLVVRPDGRVLVNGRVVGRSRGLLARMLTHLLVSAVPTCRHWLPTVWQRRTKSAPLRKKKVS